MKSLLRAIVLFVFIFCVVWLVPHNALAFGKKKPPTPTEPADTQAYPARVVSLGKFLDTPFMLPDGKTRVDMAALLPQIVVTEMGQVTNKLRTRGTPDSAPPETQDRFVFRGGITSFEAANFTNNIRFGYKPGVGDIGAGKLTGVEGKLTYNIGSLSIDFSIYDNERREVVAVGTGSALPFDGSLNVTLDFTAINTGADFVYRSPMAPLFRAAVDNAIKNMVSNPKTNFLMDWSARVVGTNGDLGRVYFNSGMRDSVEVNNVFRVYDQSDMFLGLLKVREVDMEQSGASVKEDSSNRILNSVKVGDPVRIYFQSVPR